MCVRPSRPTEGTDQCADRRCTSWGRRRAIGLRRDKAHGGVVGARLFPRACSARSCASRLRFGGARRLFLPLASPPALYRHEKDTVPEVPLKLVGPSVDPLIADQISIDMNNEIGPLHGVATALLPRPPATSEA